MDKAVPVLIDPDQKFRQAGYVLTVALDQELILMSPDTGKIIGLNRTGSAIWDQFVLSLDPRSAATNLLDRFDVTPQECLVEICRIGGVLLEAGFLIPI